MRYYVIREWCLIEDENEEAFDRCVIGHATESDEENDGKNFFGVSGGFDFNIYDSIKEAIVNANYTPCGIAFEDFTEAELNEANTIISDLCNDNDSADEE